MIHDNYINDLVVNKRIVGLNMCVVHDELKITKCYGLKSFVPYEETAKKSTLYDVASLTKVLTVLPIICKLIDAKEITFDTKVKSIIPEFKHGDITVYDMLVHQSGLPSSVNMKDKEQSRESMIGEILKLDKSYKTGTDVVYSDIAYIILGLALEKIYGNSLDVVAKEEVFKLLGMNKTAYNPSNTNDCAPTEYTDASKKEVFKGTVHDWKARMMNGVAGHAGVFSTASDIGNFMKMVLNNGYYNNKQYLSEELINMWYKTLVYEKKADRYRSLCWIRGNNKFIIDEKNDDIISFHGFSGPSISLDRKNNIGICLMSNGVHPLRENKDKLNAVRPIITDKIYADYVGIETNKTYTKK